MRTVVTGGAGFIGSHVADALLERGDEVVVVDNLVTGNRDNVPADARFVERDIREPLDDLFADLEPDACFHLAAQANVRRSVADPHYDAEVNALGTIRVLEAARPHGTQVVFSSTGGAIYGERARPAREDEHLDPISPYGVSKLAAEEYLRAYNRLYGARHVVLRYANVYGPRQVPHGEAGVVSIFFELLAAGGRPRVFGDGGQTRDYVHVADVVSATLAAQAGEGVYNVGTGIQTSDLELFEHCRRVAGADIEAEFAPARVGDLRNNVLDPGRAERELGWRRGFDVAEGLHQTWEWTVAKAAPAA